MKASIINQSVLVVMSFVATASFSIADADTLSGSGGSWQPASSWSQSQLYGNSGVMTGTPYWNNNSGEGPKGNIGWCLTGGPSNCTMSNSPGMTLAYYGSGTNSVANMYFTSSGLPVAVQLNGINTNETNADYYDVFGYYVVGSATLHPLLNTNPAGSPSSVGSVALFSLPSGTQYGYYIENIKGADINMPSYYTFFMNGSLQDGSLGPDGLQHFAIFQNGGSYIIGDVDGVGSNASGCTGPAKLVCDDPTAFDYQDLIVTASNVPEPTTVGLMGTSLLLLGGLLRRKLRKQ
jgi:hypothetical protein